MKWLVLLILLAGCGGKVTGGGGGGSVDVGNGGDARVAEWTRLGFEIVGLLRERPIPAVSSDKLESAVRSTVVGVSEKLALNGVVKDAINYPQRVPPAIVFDPTHWDGIADHHSKLFLVLHEYLGILGIDDSGYQASYQLDQAMVCRRTPAIRIAIENSLKRLCYQLTPPELRFVDKLELFDRRIGQLKTFDLAYLTQLRTLDLSHNKLETLPPGIFRDLHELTRLDLRFNEIEEFQPGTFEGLWNLQTLGGKVIPFDAVEDWYNPIKKVHPGFLTGVKKLDSLSLCSDRGTLKTLEPGTFGATKIFSLGLCFDFARPLAAESFFGTEDVQLLYLSGKGFVNLPEGIFGRMRELEELHLQLSGETLRTDQIADLNSAPSLRHIVLETKGGNLRSAARSLTAFRCSLGSGRYATGLSLTDGEYGYCERKGAGDARHPFPFSRKGGTEVFVSPFAEAL